MNANLQDWTAAGGRMLLALIFIVSGWGKIGGFAATAGHMASKGLPVPEFLLVLTIAIELGGGLMVAAGWKARWAALAIFLFLIPTTFVFHAFWAADVAKAAMDQIQFMKNLSIMGGMLILVAYGPGKLSVDKG